MNCAQHPDTPAVGYCTKCGRGLCKRCADAYDPLTCQNCYASAVTEERADLNRQYKKLIMWSALLGLVGLWIGCSGSTTKAGPPPGGAILGPLFIGYLFAGIPWGWNTVGKVTSRFFLILPVMGWVLYFVYKIAASMTIGWIVMPFKLRKAIIFVRAANQLAS